MKYRDSASFGKRQEYIAVAELLQRGFDVYMTLVDDQGIDCIIRLDDKRYLDIQIKARSQSALQWNFFAAMKFKPRENLYFIFYTAKDNNYWILPSHDVLALGCQNIGGKHKGKIHLSLPKKDDGVKAERFKKYKNDNGFNSLRSALKKRNETPRHTEGILKRPQMERV